MGQITRTNFGLSRVITIAHAAILTLPTVPVTLVPAITGKIILPLLIWWKLSPWVANYTNIDVAANAGVNINGLFTEPTFAPGAILAQGAATVIWQLVGRDYDYTPAALASMQSQPLVTSWENAAAGPFTGGNATSVLTCQVFYNVLPGA